MPHPTDDQPHPTVSTSGAARAARPPAERRRHPRWLEVTPCKVVDPATGRCLPARTLNRSVGGALIELPRAWPLHEGQEILAAIPAGPDGGGSLMRLADCTRSIVRRRVLRPDGTQLVAVQHEMTPPMTPPMTVASEPIPARRLRLAA